MLLSLRKNGLTSLFKEVRVFKVVKPSVALKKTRNLVGASVIFHFSSSLGAGLVAQIARCNGDVRCDSNRTPPSRQRCENFFR